MTRNRERRREREDFSRRRGGALGAALLPAAALLSAVLMISGCYLDPDYDKYALVYGISNYDDLSIYDTDATNDLWYTDDDARSMAALLEANGYQATLRVDDENSGTQEVTRTNLEADIQAVASQADSLDQFVFFFSGHGFFTSQTSGSEPAGANSYDEAIVLSEPGSGNDNLWDDELAALLAQLPTVKNIVIIDACNSGGFIGNELEIDTSPQVTGEEDDYLFTELAGAVSLYTNYNDSDSDIPPELALVLAAAGERENSYEENGYEHGIFTYYLLESANNGDRNGDGYVSALESYNYAWDKIKDNWNSLYTSNQYTPRVSGGPVDYLLFY
ncbi:MAG: caspase family protein [Spirochaetales bacterium]|nr:caspase family protein [Spirochaetales bacterium]MCF7937586.1 caspase family protein [Spirochaetales bacterium]